MTSTFSFRFTIMPLPQSLTQFTVLINGSPLVDNDVRKIARITVEKDLNLPGYFELELASQDSRPETARWIDDPVFVPGNEVKIAVTVADQNNNDSENNSEPETNTLIVGEITGLEPVFSYNRSPSLIICGYDYLYRLQGSSLTQSYLQQKDSQIAAQMAGEVGLTANVKDSEVIHEYLVQTNQTNLHFLQTRAERIGYNLYVDGQEGKTLFFQPITIIPSSNPLLTLAEDLQEFIPRLSTIAPATQINVKGWDFKKKQAVAENASSAISRPSTSAVATIVDRPCITDAEARQQAKAQAQQEALNLIEAEGMTWGRTDIQLAKTIQISGLGTRFSGSYYVTGVTHQRDGRGQFNTHFRVKRQKL
jgi:uncharacterized protein